MKQYCLALLILMTSWSYVLTAQVPSIYDENPKKKQVRSFDKLIKEYTLKIKNDSLNDALYFQRGRAFGKKGNLDKAIEDFSIAIELDSTVPTYYVRMGIALELKNDYERAQINYKVASILDPNNNDAYYGLGNCALKLSKFKEATIHFDEQIRLVPQDYASYINKGIALYNLEEYERSIASIQKGLKISKNKLAYQYLGLNFYFLNQSKSAIKYLTLAQNADDQEGLLYYYRGLSQKKIGAIKKACSDLKKAKKLGYTLTQELNELCD